MSLYHFSFGRVLKFILDVMSVLGPRCVFIHSNSFPIEPSYSVVVETSAGDTNDF